ncbi:MAG: hypothetical protein AB7S38_43220 [Vulcanimicrobiota bacterium]
MSEPRLPAVPTVETRPAARDDLLEATLKVGSRRLVARFLGSQLRPGAEALLETFASNQPESGTRVSLGWCDLVLAEQGCDLIVCEPDFETEPYFKRVEQVTTALEVASAQANFLKLYDLSPDPCGFRDRLLVAGASLQSPRLVMHRHSQARAGNSGWYFGPVEAEAISNLEEFAKPMSGRLVKVRPALLAALTMPEGSLVLVEDDRLVEVRDPQGQVL